MTRTTLGNLERPRFAGYAEVNALTSTPMLIVLASLATLAWAIVAAIIYAYVDLHLPYEELGAIASSLYGVSLGMVPLFILPLRTTCDRRLVIGLALLAAGVSYYSTWAVWICDFLDSVAVPRDFSWLQLAISPRKIWNIVLKINEFGAWSASGSSGETPHLVTGGELWVAWAGELIATFGGAVLGITRLHERFIAIGIRASQPPPPMTRSLSVSPLAGAPTDVPIAEPSEASPENSPSPTSGSPPAGTAVPRPPDSDIGVI